MGGRRGVRTIFPGMNGEVLGQWEDDKGGRFQLQQKARLTVARGTAAWEGCWKSQEGPHQVPPERFPPCLSLTLFLEGFPTSALWVWLLTSFITSVPAMSSDWPGMIEFGSGNSLMSKKTANVRKVSMI